MPGVRMRGAIVAIAAASLASGCRERTVETGQLKLVDPALLMAPRPQPLEEVTHLYGSAPTGFSASRTRGWLNWPGTPMLIE